MQGAERGKGVLERLRVYEVRLSRRSAELMGHE